MTDLDLVQDLRGVWLRHRASARARLESAQRDMARADAELDAIDVHLAQLRLAAASALLDPRLA